MEYQIKTVRQMLAFAADKYDKKTAFVQIKKKEEIPVSFSEVYDQVLSFGEWLAAEGIADKRVSIYGENSYQWILTDFTVTAGGGVAVPIDKELQLDQIEFLLKDSESDVLIFSDSYSDIATELKKTMADMRFINMKEIDSLVKNGKMLRDNGKCSFLENAPDADDLAMILYTSGTTGRSKGVMLSHLNLMSQLKVLDALNLGDVGKRSLQILPLHHAFGITASVYCTFFVGCTNYINRSLRKLKEDIDIAKPDIVLAVPMVLKFLLDSINKSIEEKGQKKKFERGIILSGFLRIIGIDKRRQLFQDVIDALGGNLKVFVVGGAPIDQNIIDAFDDIGITVLNGYGISECAPVVSVNGIGTAVKRSAGKPLATNEVRISERGEILVKGDNVMKGYYHLDEETQNAFDNGWFCTGDLGELDNKGNLFITGRIKNLIILDNGENVPAEPLEELIYRIPYVKETVVYGDNGKIIAEIYLDPDIPEGKEKIRADIDTINKSLPPSRTIVSIKIRDEEFPKTTTKKIKRTAISK